MATVKKISSNYVVQTPRDVTSNITLDTDTVYITGNLTIAGDTFHANVTNSDITDRLIVLNYGETGNGVANGTGTSGIIIDRGTAPGGNVRLRWNESTATWQISGVASGKPGDGTQYLNIATTTGGTALTAVVDDPNPVLGGSLNTDGHEIKANTNVILKANLQIFNANIAPSAVAGCTTLYSQSPAAGQAGLYVVNSDSTNEELVTKRRAFGFSLLL